ncbi:MAG: HlyD family efflux transporter periplasmic adaptor subunit [Acidobacteriota bacterium]|nr:HlyD family efflux transporter periplasmic adaptor subunit [Acidobacteriota bacterium]
MNLTETLNVALPDIPIHNQRRGYFKLHPALVGKEHMEGDERVVSAIISKRPELFTFTPEQWTIVNLFDGKRSFEEIAELYFRQSGVRYSQEEIASYAEELDSVDFWFKTPLEKNIALRQKLAEERGKHKKKTSKYGDVSHIEFNAWDPDDYLEKVNRVLAFMYTPWFTLVTLLGFLFMAYIFVIKWSEIGVDTLQFYDMTVKSGWEIAEFWLLACLVLFIHETAHGISCKHYGGHVHRMGFHLIYLTPAFFTDVTEAWVYADKWQRVVTIVSGAWSEMMICAIAAPIWYVTPYGTWVHEFAYKLILITGLGVLFFNWNPLIKLDGYYLLTEIIAIPNLKEDATAYTSALVKRLVWRLPIEIPYVAKKRRVGFVVYALASGAYSYMILYIVARFAGNLTRGISGDWAFIPAIAIGLLIFRSRIKTLVSFMQTVYLDKKERLRVWFTPQRSLAVAVAGLVLIFAPLWQDSIEGRFILEPKDHAVLRAAVAGVVEQVNAQEGQAVSAGDVLIRMRNLQLESEAGRARADFVVANARFADAQLHFADYVPAQHEREQARISARQSADRLERLAIPSPLNGTISSPRPQDLENSYVKEGAVLLEVVDGSMLKARIYIPEFDVRKVTIGEPARLLCDDRMRPLSGTVESILPASEDIQGGLMHKTEYKGTRPPRFYVVTILVANQSDSLKIGMPGTAKVFHGRKSVAGMLWEPLWDTVSRKVW